MLTTASSSFSYPDRRAGVRIHTTNPESNSSGISLVLSKTHWGTVPEKLLGSSVGLALAREASLWPASLHLSSSQSAVWASLCERLLFLITLIRITEALVIILTRCHSAHRCKSVGPHFPLRLPLSPPLFAPQQTASLSLTLHCWIKKQSYFTPHGLYLSLPCLSCFFFFFPTRSPYGPPPSPPAPLPYIKAVLTSESAV